MRRTLGILLLLLPASLSEAQDGDGFIPLTDPDLEKAAPPKPGKEQVGEPEKSDPALPPAYAKAIRDLKADIAFIEGFGKKDSEQLIEPLLHLAKLYTAAGRFPEAEEASRRALKIANAEHGEEHPLVATSLNNIAAALEEQGKYAEAGAMFREALAMRKKLLGAEHPGVATSLNNLAEALESQGEYAEAKLQAQRALAIQEKALGSKHPDLADTLDTLAGIHKGLGDEEKAEAYSKRAEAIREKSK